MEEQQTPESELKNVQGLPDVKSKSRTRIPVPSIWKTKHSYESELKNVQGFPDVKSKSRTRIPVPSIWKTKHSYVHPLRTKRDFPDDHCVDIIEDFQEEENQEVNNIKEEEKNKVASLPAAICKGLWNLLIYLFKLTWLGKQVCSKKNSIFFKVVATIVTLAVLGGYIKLMAAKTQRYLKFETTTNIELIYEEQSRLPHGAICTQNPIRRSSLDKLPSFLADHIKDAINNTEKVYQYINSLYYISDKMYSLNMSSLKHIGMNWNTDIIFFIFNGKILRLNESFYRQFYTYQFGMCLSLDVDKIRSYLESQGFVSGLNGDSLEVALFVNHEDVIPQIATSVGYNLHLHDSDQLPEFNKIGTDLSPGTRSYVSVKKILHERLPSPHSDCLNDLPFVVNSSVRLNHQLCLEQCKGALILKECGCIHPVTPELDEILKSKYSYCRLIGKECPVEIKNCNCSVACRQTYYETEISQSLWPTPYLAKLIIKAMCDARIIKDVECNNYKIKNDSELVKYFTSFQLSFGTKHHTAFKESAVMTDEDFSMEGIEITGTSYGVSIYDLGKKFAELLHEFFTYLRKRLK